MHYILCKLLSDCVQYILNINMYAELKYNVTWNVHSILYMYNMYRKFLFILMNNEYILPDNSGVIAEEHHVFHLFIDIL